MKVWKYSNERVIGRYSLCFTKQGDSKKRVKSCMSQSSRRILMRHFSEMQKEVRQIVTSIRCNASPIGTSDARHRGKTRHGRNPGGSSNRRLDDMISMPFDPHIINYEPSRGFIVPKFTIYNRISDPFNHIMHFRQLMTLDIRNDALLYVGKRVTHRLHEMVRTSRSLGRILQTWTPSSEIFK
ncbi:hypothetical protein AAG906_012703 [Vitis piasezkii]